MAKLLVLAALCVGAFAAPEVLRVDPSLSWRIVGGSKADPGQFPYQISMRDSSGGHMCGGSIIDSTTILTAAHCVQGASPSQISIVVGSNTLNPGGTKYAVSAVRAHTGFSFLTIKNDIAILKVAEPIQFSATVSTIDLEANDVGGGVDAVLSGWGTTSFPGSAPNDLQYLNLKTVSVADCKSKRPFYPPVRDSHVCTFTQRGEGACHGDSGGPLAANGKQIGVVSFGSPCAVGDPDVFTRVSSFIDWIEANRQ